jgi:O-acetylserine/cysteine efflux transporter
VAFLEYLNGPPSAWTPPAVAGLLYLAVVVVALAFVAWNYALERVEAPRAAIFLNLQPLAGALLAALWLGEPLTPFTIAGGLLILAGLRLAVRGRTPSRAPGIDPPAGQIG